MISSCCVLLQSHECFTASFRHSPLYSLFSLIPIRTPDLFVFSFCIFWRPRSFYFWTLCASLSFASLASKHGIFLLSCTTRRQTQVCEKSRLLIWWPFPCHVLLSFFIFFSPHLFFPPAISFLFWGFFSRWVSTRSLARKQNGLNKERTIAPHHHHTTRPRRNISTICFVFLSLEVVTGAWYQLLLWEYQNTVEPLLLH